MLRYEYFYTCKYCTSQANKSPYSFQKVTKITILVFSERGNEMKIKFASSPRSPKSDKESLLQFFNISLRS